MTVQTSKITGSFVYPAAAGERPVSTVEEMEAAIRVLQQHKTEWAGQSIGRG